jgi:hypothetical protein
MYVFGVYECMIFESVAGACLLGLAGFLVQEVSWLCDMYVFGVYERMVFGL